MWADGEDSLSVAAPVAICTDHSLGRRPVEECQANARLIAAAPDLLAVLKDFAEQYAGWPEHQFSRAGLARRDAALKAIAKAEGR
ncbi:hypothetical protein LOK46_13640 [Methylobacterium sp. NMS14P]|uniref:hypothetical protein n=1 Tax=Methylobacterium sp. NMS14P TaxID=2894310 RepID=UPI0023592338|nr:hypothetical protein [Methylobacterium sp. NMS14P]WCS27818.1 hypothetical protein LOK46_13640 [Methylobacterium sp. NMS14P]